MINGIIPPLVKILQIMVQEVSTHLYNWLTGPRFINTTFDLEPTETVFSLVNPVENKEIHVEVNKVVISEALYTLHDITEIFSTWKLFYPVIYPPVILPSKSQIS